MKETNMHYNETVKEGLKEYLREISCRVGFHSYKEWENTSRFISPAYWSFGWIARYGRKCKYCNHLQEKKPFLRSEQKRLIAEANKK